MIKRDASDFAVFAWAIGFSYAAALLVIVVAVGLRSGFGVQDAPFLLFWTLPIAILGAFMARWLHRHTRGWSRVAGYFVSVLAGTFVGVGWTAFTRLILGPMFGAISLPALTCWIMSGVSGIAGGLLFANETTSTRRVTHGLILVGFSVVVTLASEPAVVRLRNDQALTLLIVKWTPGAGPPSIETDLPFVAQNEMNDEALTLLGEATGRGRMNVQGRSVHGRGPTATAVIVLQSPLQTRVSVPQPDRAIVVYVQEDWGFRSYPERVKVLERRIELGERDGRLSYSVDLATGGKQGGSVSW